MPENNLGGVWVGRRSEIIGNSLNITGIKHIRIMARIKQVGIGRMASGTIDGITYVTRGNVTFARSTPTMPAHVYTSPAAKRRRAIFTMIQMHLKHHLPTLRKTITPKGIGSAYTRYYSLNAKPLARALGALAEELVAGKDVAISDVEEAITAYATEHPDEICIASLKGYKEVFLSGPWPDTLTLNAVKGKSTIVISVI
jgi:hypothetical protein